MPPRSGPIGDAKALRPGVHPLNAASICGSGSSGAGRGLPSRCIRVRFPGPAPSIRASGTWPPARAKALRPGRRCPDAWRAAVYRIVSVQWRCQGFALFPPFAFRIFECLFWALKIGAWSRRLAPGERELNSPRVHHDTSGSLRRSHAAAACQGAAGVTSRCCRLRATAGRWTASTGFRGGVAERTNALHWKGRAGNGTRVRIPVSPPGL